MSPPTPRPALVLLHGLGLSGRMWDAQVAALSGHFHCVAVDLPGSGTAAAQRWGSFADAADGIAGVVEEVAPDGAAHVVGLSLGGYVALALLARHPDRVQSAVVSGVTTRALSPAWLHRPLARVGVRLLRRPVLVRASARALRMPADATEVFVADAARLAPQAGDRVYDELIDGYRAPHLGPAAARLLAVAGGKEVRSVRAGLADLAAAGATTALVPDARHAWNTEHPALFARTVRGWALDRALPPELVAAGARP